MSDQPITSSRDGDVAIVRMDDGKANALSHASIDAFNAALDTAERDAGAVVVVGRPGRFCAGFDLSVINAGPTETQELVRRGGELALRLFMFPRPVVAACTGHALAAGAIILMAADHRVGAQGAFKIGLNEVSIGLPLPIFLTELAQQRLSRRHLTAATMLAHIFDPDTARDAGFLDEVLDPDEVEARAVDRARDFASTLNLRAFAASREPLRGPAAERIAATMTSDIARFFVDR
ncbi:MAG TPA: crotonase/enoyl-CoA hydratase family protein [Acidimicrobiales bacterium]|nr:crotonase/enoyl-CoA hydratase family protein [Acidimicrobiales bacterium]